MDRALRLRTGFNKVRRDSTNETGYKKGCSMMKEEEG